SGATARASTTRSSKRPECCARRSKTRSPNWRRSASCTPTAFPACARCSHLPIGASRSARVSDAGAPRSSASRMRAVGRSSGGRRVLRRLEARGEIRGGRFVAGISGEQFALPEAVDLMRETRRVPASVASAAWISLSAADPLNLVGNIVPGPKVPAVTNNRVLYRNGIAVAALIAGEIQWIGEIEPRERAEAASALVKRQTGSPLLAYLR